MCVTFSFAYNNNILYSAHQGKIERKKKKERKKERKKEKRKKERKKNNKTEIFTFGFLNLEKGWLNLWSRFNNRIANVS